MSGRDSLWAAIALTVTAIALLGSAGVRAATGRATVTDVVVVAFGMLSGLYAAFAWASPAWGAVR